MQSKKIVLTKDLIQAGISNNNGFSVKQIAALGENQKISGWFRRLVGKVVTEEEYRQFLNLKNAHLKMNRVRLEPEKVRKKKKLPKRLRKSGSTLDPEKYYADTRASDRFSRFIRDRVKVTGDIPYEEQYKHPNWQIVRLIVLERDNFMCVKCKDGQNQLHVHHKKYYGDYVWDVHPIDLETLCSKCHKEHHKK